MSRFSSPSDPRALTWTTIYNEDFASYPSKAPTFADDPAFVIGAHTYALTGMKSGAGRYSQFQHIINQGLQAVWKSNNGTIYLMNGEWNNFGGPLPIRLTLPLAPLHPELTTRTPLRLNVQYQDPNVDLFVAENSDHGQQVMFSMAGLARTDTVAHGIWRTRKCIAGVTMENACSVRHYEAGALIDSHSVLANTTPAVLLQRAACLELREGLVSFPYIYRAGNANYDPPWGGDVADYLYLVGNYGELGGFSVLPAARLVDAQDIANWYLDIAFDVNFNVSASNAFHTSNLRAIRIDALLPVTP